MTEQQYNQILNKVMPWTEKLQDIDPAELQDSIEVGEAGYQEITFEDNKGSKIL